MFFLQITKNLTCRINYFNSFVLLLLKISILIKYHPLDNIYPTYDDTLTIEIKFNNSNLLTVSRSVPFLLAA